MAKASPPADRASNGQGNHSNRLTLYIVTGIVAAVVLALIFPRFAMAFDVGGQIFLRLLQMVVVPLVMASVMSGILGLGDIRKLGRPGGMAVGYYMTTTVLAVATGLVVVNIVNPGVGIDKKLVEDARKEGARDVAKAAEASGKRPVPITWDDAATDQRLKSGESDPVEASTEHRQVVRLTIMQQGDAAKGAQVRILTSKDGRDFKPFLWEVKGQQREAFVAGAEEGTYTTSVPLPRRPGQVKLQYTAAQGGQFSQLKAALGPAPPGIMDIFKNLVLMLFTDNLLASMVEINLLPLIVFSIVFAGMLTTMGGRAETITNFVTSINEALMSFILLLMKLAPLGIFCLVASRFGKAQAEGNFLELIRTQAYYMATVLIGLALHAMITLPVLLYVFTRRSPLQFVRQMSQAILTAFSTASSTATLPVTMECAEKQAGISKRSTEFVLPLGATINMDGTALYEAAAAIFIAQAYAMVDPAFQLDLLGQMTVAVTATLAAIGAAGIPEAGLVTMLIVLNAVGLPLELIALILPVDWLLDRFRTAVNSFGDSVGAAIVEKSFPA